MGTSLAPLVPYRGWRRSLLGLLAALALLVAFPAAAQAAIVYVDTAGTDSASCGAAPGSACRTLTQAVANAAAGDTVQVGAGRFNIPAEATFTKSLTYRGAKAGVPVGQRDLVDLTDETVLHEADAPTTAVGALMKVQAANVVVDGFVFSGNPNGYGLRTEGESGTIDYGGYRIVNNIFTGNRVGMYLRDGRDSVVSNNLFHDSGAPGSATPNGHGIYADDSANNVTISDNQFRDNAMSLSLVPGPGDGSNVTYSGNVSIKDAHGVNFNGVVGLDIIDNTMQGGAEGGISLVGDGLDDVLVEGNLITQKGSYGINLNTYGQPANGKVTIRENTILDTRATGSGVGWGITLADNAISEELTIEYNRIVDSANVGLRNREKDVKVDARRNWWGCNLGPGTEGCDTVIGAENGLTPVSAPWLTLSLSLRDAAPPVPAGGSATLFAQLANLSAGGLADGPFFRRAPATFASEPAGGTLNPVTTTLSTNEVTATSAFTAGPRPTEWSVTVDHQIVRLFNTDPPGPDVVPEVVPSDTTLTPGQPEVITVALVNRGNQIARRLRVCTRVSAKLNRSGKRCSQIASLPPGHTVIRRVRARVRRGACRGRLVHRVRLQVAGQTPRVRRAVARLIARRCPPPAVTG